MRCYFCICSRSHADRLLFARESVTNNRIKSGYENRPRAPIDMVPSAGARAGQADGIETTEPSIANIELQVEDGILPRSSSSSSTQDLTNGVQFLSPQNQIPHLRV